MQSDFSTEWIDNLIVIEFQIHDTTYAEAGNNCSRPGVESDQAITRCYIKNSFFSAIGPVGKSTSRQLSWSNIAAAAFVFRMTP
jgi:hypothetical protein